MGAPLRNLIPRELCAEAMQRFKGEVKPHKGFIYRQATGNPERHVLTSQRRPRGFAPRQPGHFRSSALSRDAVTG